MLVLFCLVAQMDILKTTNVFLRVLGAGTAMCCLETLFQIVLCSYRLTINLPPSDSPSLTQPRLAEQNRVFHFSSHGSFPCWQQGLQGLPNPRLIPSMSRFQCAKVFHSKTSNHLKNNPMATIKILLSRNELQKAGLNDRKQSLDFKAASL